ncbi:MAG: diguanylate cyclase [Planctomycetota bacterium]|nr:diguanylate cyclase [Planctomycetota bacterium]
MPESRSEESNHDLFSLTQIRHLMRVEFSRAQRYGYPVSCLVVALDRAGHLRDVYGYEAKENVMEDVAKLLLTATRTCDYLGRLVDDRLMAILPHTRRDGAEVTAGRVIAAARQLSYGMGDASAAVTLSIGVTRYENENTMFFDDLVAAAELAVEEAFAAGGDQCVYRDPGPVRPSQTTG